MGLGKILKKGLGIAATVGSVVPGPWQLPAAAVSTGLGMLESGKRQAKADKYRGKGLDLALGEYTRRAPIRNRALDLALRGLPSRPDLSSDFADPTNPFARSIGPLQSLDPVGAPPVPRPPSFPSGPGGIMGPEGGGVLGPGGILGAGRRRLPRY